MNEMVSDDDLEIFPNDAHFITYFEIFKIYLETLNFRISTSRFQSFESIALSTVVIRPLQTESRLY